MKTIHKAFLKELLISFAIAIAALNLVLISEKLLRFTKLLASVGASMSDMALIALYLQPQVSVLTVPMAFLLSTLLTYGRLIADNEITVLRASGMSFREASRPVFYLGAGCFVLGISLGLFISPASSARLRLLVSRVVAERAPFAIEEGIFSTAFKDVVMFVNEKPGRQTMRGVFLYDERPGRRPTAIYAEAGRFTGANGESITLDLSDGNVLVIQDGTTTEISFGLYSITVPVAVSNPAKKYNELSPLGLLREARTGEPEDRAKMILEFHRRLTLPAVCLVLMFLGPPLSLMAGKSGRLGGLVIGLAVFSAYYAALMYGESLVKSGRLPHYAGAWAPAAVLMAAAFYAYRSKTEAGG